MTRHVNTMDTPLIVGIKSKVYLINANNFAQCQIENELQHSGCVTLHKCLFSKAMHMTVMICLNLNNHGEKTNNTLCKKFCFSLQALQLNEKPQWSPCSMKTGIKVGDAV